MIIIIMTTSSQENHNAQNGIDASLGDVTHEAISARIQTLGSVGMAAVSGLAGTEAAVNGGISKAIVAVVAGYFAWKLSKSAAEAAGDEAEQSFNAQGLAA